MSTCDITLCRCLLFTPATSPARFHKAAEVGSDGIVIDLEDGVSQDKKDEARSGVIQYLRGYTGAGSGRRFVTAIRVNSIRTQAGLKDLVALVESQVHPDLILLPKVESPAEIEIAALNLTGIQGDIQFMALIETAIGLEQASQIARSGHRLKALSFGGADMAADLGAVYSWEAMLFARSRIVQAAATVGIDSFDSPYLNIKDDSGLQEECEKVRSLGYTGKMAIHPDHVPTIIAAFSPDAPEVERAHRIVAAFEAAGGGVCEIDGKMVDKPVYRAAKRALR